MEKDYSKLDPESRQQMIIIDLQSAAEKNARDIEELKKMFWEDRNAYGGLTRGLKETTSANKMAEINLRGKLAIAETELIKLRNDYLELAFEVRKLAVEVRGLGKQDADKPNLLEVIRNLFKRK